MRQLYQIKSLISLFAVCMGFVLAFWQFFHILGPKKGILLLCSYYGRAISSFWYFPAFSSQLPYFPQNGDWRIRLHNRHALLLVPCCIRMWRTQGNTRSGSLWRCVRRVGSATLHNVPFQWRDPSKHACILWWPWHPFHCRFNLENMGWNGNSFATTNVHIPRIQ